MKVNRMFRAAVAALALGVAGGALAIDQLKVMIPAGPGGGFDQTGRNLAAAMQAAGSIKSAQFDNKGGAGGAIGLAQFVTTSKGDPNALFVSGFVTVGATAMNRSPVTLANVTPIARLTAEADAIIVPANSPFKSMKDVVAALKANPGAVSFSGGSAGRHRPHPGRTDRQGGRRRPGQGQLRGVHQRRRSRRRGAGRAGERGHLGLRRVRPAHQVGPRARAGGVRRRQARGRPVAEGAGHQRRTRQLARRLRRARNHARAGEGAHRRRRGRHPEREVAGDAAEARLERRTGSPATRSRRSSTASRSGSPACSTA